MDTQYHPLGSYQKEKKKFIWFNVVFLFFMSNEAIPFDVVHKHLSKSSKFLYLSWVIFVESEILTT